MNSEQYLSVLLYNFTSLTQPELVYGSNGANRKVIIRKDKNKRLEVTLKNAHNIQCDSTITKKTAGLLF